MNGARNFWRVGAPMVVFACGGCWMLTQFVGGKLEIQGQRTKSLTERQYEMEQEYSKTMSELKSFDYELKPIPKPESE